MWIYREHLSSTQGEVYLDQTGAIHGRYQNPSDPNASDEVLFQHDGLLTLKFNRTHNDYLRVYTLNDQTDEQVIQVKVPRGEWIWIQAEHSENYFGVQV